MFRSVYPVCGTALRCYVRQVVNSGVGVRAMGVIPFIFLLGLLTLTEGLSMLSEYCHKCSLTVTGYFSNKGNAEFRGDRAVNNENKSWTDIRSVYL